MFATWNKHKWPQKSFEPLSCLHFLQLIVTGGANSGTDISNTFETLTSSDGWKKSLQELPASVYFHCSVKLNEKSVMVIGGTSLFSDGSQTYIYNADTDAWTSGPALKYGRHHHDCAGMNLDGKYRYAKNIYVPLATLKTKFN